MDNMLKTNINATFYKIFVKFSGGEEAAGVGQREAGDHGAAGSLQELRHS
jgi:hypothetical protein